jgi:hypothetical protein
VNLFAVALLVQHLFELFEVPQSPRIVVDAGGQEAARRMVGAPGKILYVFGGPSKFRLLN